MFKIKKSVFKTAHGDKEHSDFVIKNVLSILSKSLLQSLQMEVFHMSMETQTDSLFSLKYKQV